MARGGSESPAFGEPARVTTRYSHRPKEKPLSPTAARSAPNRRDSLLNAYISAYQAKDARAYLSLFSQDADYVDFGVQVHAKISQLKDELASSFHRQAFRLVFHSSFPSADGKSAALQGTYNDSA